MQKLINFFKKLFKKTPKTRFVQEKIIVSKKFCKTSKRKRGNK